MSVASGRINGSLTAHGRCVELDGPGPLVGTVQNRSANTAYMFFMGKRPSDDYWFPIISSLDTEVASENTGFTGDDVTLAFTGQDLNNDPCLPGMVRILATATSPLLYDRDADGILYSYDTDAEVSGTVNYQTGALVLAFGAGKAPAAGAINASYVHPTAQIAAWENTAFTIMGTTAPPVPSADFCDRITPNMLVRAYVKGAGATVLVRVMGPGLPQ